MLLFESFGIREKKITMKKSFTLYLLLGFITACSTSQPEKTGNKPVVSEEKSVIKPIEGMEIPIRTFTVSATEKSVIDLPNGGKISFPGNAFVDENGKAITGKVDIQWQEYHSLTDILFSGIPMTYDSLGVTRAFESGGMFTISAVQNGKTVELAPGKNAGIDLASYNDRKTFNFYSLDDKSGKWDYQTTATATENPKAVSGSGSPAKKVSTYTLDVTPVISKDSFPELNPDEIIAWEVDKSQIGAKELASFTLKKVDARIIQRNRDHYVLSLKEGKNTKTVQAKPITFASKSSSNDLAKTTVEDKLKLALEYQNLAQQGQLIRSIEIPKFGTYNWDCMYEKPTEDIFVKLDVENREDDEYTCFFYVIPKDGIIVPIEEHSKVRVSLENPSTIVAITKDKEVYSVKNQDLNKAIHQQGQREFTFQMSGRRGILREPRDMSRLLPLCV